LLISEEYLYLTQAFYTNFPIFVNAIFWVKKFKKLSSVILRNGFSSHDEESQGKQILRLRLRMTRKSKFFGCAIVTIGWQTTRRGI